MFDFKKQVIERSFIKPVLVDFWASWCGPCKVLAPVLEQLAEEQSDRWELVKLDTENHLELAKEYGIQSIPNVKLFHRGEVIGEFLGALPKFQIQQWLDANIPDESDIGLENITSGANAQSWEETTMQLEAFVAAHPGHEKAKLALARHIIFQRPIDAAELMGDFEEYGQYHEDAEDILVLAQLMLLEDKDDSPVAGILKDARHALQQNKLENGIQKIIDATMADKKYMDGLPRRAAIALFHLWGTGHELTKEYRRPFSMALY